MYIFRICTIKSLYQFLKSKKLALNHTGKKKKGKQGGIENLMFFWANMLFFFLKIDFEAHL